MPFHAFHITVPLSPEQVTERLRTEVAEPYFFWKTLFTRQPREYLTGRIKGNRFNVTYLRPHRRNSFHPTIRGTITASGTGSRIDVVMYMNPLGAAFLALWFCGGIGLVISGGIHPLKMFIGGLAFSFAGLLLMVAWFWDDAMKAKKVVTLALYQEDTKLVVDTTPHKDSIRCEKCGHFNSGSCSTCLYCGTQIL